MAIQKSITDKYGVTHTAYLRIDKVSVQTQYEGTSTAEIFVEIYTSSSARSKADAANRKTPFMAGRYRVEGSDFNTYFADGVLDDDTKSPLKQAYAWLKTKNDSSGNGQVFGVDWTTGTSDV